MKSRTALAVMACAGALLVAQPASTAPVGTVGAALETAQVKSSLVEEVHWRRHHRRFAHFRHRHHHHFYPYYYSYYPYYDYPYYYPYRRHRHHGFSIYLNF